MTDKVTPTANTAAVNKAPPYRPQLPPRRLNRTSFCRSFCLWTTLLITLILLIAAIAAAAFCVLYRPHRPLFSVASVQLSQFNLTDTSLTSAFNLTLAARNRNKKIAFFYDQVSVKILSGGVDIGDGAIAGFIHGKKNVTTLRAVVSSSNNNRFPDGTDLSQLRSSLKSKNLGVKIQLDTRVMVKIGKIETKKFKIRVTCDGIKISIPSGKTTSATISSNAKCKVDPRIKIIRWTV